jgi:hypothetical protein
MPHAPARPRFARASTNRLTRHDLGRFGGSSLFDAVGRAVCMAGCLPRKELFEAWEMARRVRRRFRGGRVVDLAGGHGLLAHVLLLLDDSSPSAIVVDAAIPPSAGALHDAIVGAWPRLRDRLGFVTGDLDGVPLDTHDLVVSCHACGGLTDRVLARAAAARARVAVLPCCHETREAASMPAGGWLDPALAIDVARAHGLAVQGYQVWTHHIPPDVTPKHRLLMGAPVGFAGRAVVPDEPS